MALIKINYSMCTGCRLCEYACSAKHYNYFGTAYRIKIDTNEIEGINIPILCRQCKSPACIKACPKTAISLNINKIPTIDTDLCSKCQLCIKACPFGAISMDAYTNIVVCDLCFGSPECAKICPSGALELGE